MKIIYIFLLIIASIYLQIYLSKKENKILGLILPVMSFLNSILFFVQAIKFSVALKFLLISNIPTIILIMIYIYSRKKINKNSDIDKMNIQDL